MEKILIGRCLQGEKVRWNGSGIDTLLKHPIYLKWQKAGRLVGVCPELLANGKIPRFPAEIRGQIAGDNESLYKKFKSGEIKIVENRGENGRIEIIDVTQAYMHGAEEVLKIVKKNKIKIAILTDGSPSCGNGQIYDGTFTGKTKAGYGILTVILKYNGVQVFNQNQLEAAENFLNEIIS